MTDIEALCHAALTLLDGAAATDPAVQGAIAAARDGTRAALATGGTAGTAKGTATPASERYLGQSLAAGESGPAAGLAAAVARAKGALHWHYGYPPLAGQPDLPNRIAFCEFVGPKAPVHSDTMRLGLTLIGPHTHYPAHAHPAVELYYVIAGTARWATDAADAPQPPGAYVLHKASQPHLMETGAEPLLSLYAWSGEILAPSVYTPDALSRQGRRQEGA